MAGWLESPGHCANIMDPGFTEMGSAYAINPDSKTGTANLAYVTSANQADTFAHLTNIHSVDDLAALHLTASDFTFV